MNVARAAYKDLNQWSQQRFSIVSVLPLKMSNILDLDASTGNRYFVEQRIICRFCRQEGHILRDCKEKATLCLLCKQDHDPLRCPLSDICFNCYTRGHVRQSCRSKARNRFCEYCNVYTHITLECTLVWRQYRFRTKKKALPVQTVYCYKCGKQGHFGDDCGNKTLLFRDSAFKSDANVAERFTQAYIKSTY